MTHPSQGATFTEPTEAERTAFLASPEGQLLKTKMESLAPTPAASELPTEHARNCGWWTEQDMSDCNCALFERQRIVELEEQVQKLLRELAAMSNPLADELAKVRGERDELAKWQATAESHAAIEQAGVVRLPGEGWLSAICRLTTSLARVAELERDNADLKKYDKQLSECTTALEHWPLASGCNGYLCVAGHIEVILKCLATTEQRLGDVTGLLQELRCATTISCENLLHQPSQYHEPGSPCPAEHQIDKRIKAALAAGGDDA